MNNTERMKIFAIYSTQSMNIMKKATLVITILLLLGGCRTRSLTPKVNRYLFLFTLDTLRPDHIGTYGNQRLKTPILDLFAKKGIVFQNAAAESSWTIPSHASLFTARYPRSHGAIFKHRTLDDRMTTMAEILTDNGFLSGAVIGSRILGSNRGFNQGFTFFEEELSKPERRGSAVAESAIKWLNKIDIDSRDIFLWLHFYDAHKPYDPPEIFKGMYPPAKANDFDRYFIKKYAADVAPKHKAKVSMRLSDERAQDIGIPITDEIVARAKSLYDGEISYLDNQIERIFRNIGKKGILTNSSIIFTADHGEYFGEDNNYFCHACSFGNPALHIPLIMIFPHFSQKNKIFDTPVQLTDILPTMLSSYGIVTSPHNFAGRNLMPLITKDQPPNRRHIFSEYHPLTNWNWYGVGGRDTLLLTGKKESEVITRLIDLNTGKDMPTDSEITRKKITSLEKQLDNWKQEQEEYIIETPFVETEEMKENLKALGYLD